MGQNQSTVSSTRHHNRRCKLFQSDLRGKETDDKTKRIVSYRMEIPVYILMESIYSDGNGVMRMTNTRKAH